MSYIGTNKVGKMYLGSTAIGKVYLGSDLVYDSTGGGQVLPYDAQVDYLQSSGTQYIDTGIIGNQNTKINVKFYATELDTFVHGCRGDNTNSITYFVANSDNVRFGNQTFLTSTAINTLYEIVQDKTKLSINGVDNSYGTVSDFTTPSNLHIFGASGTEYALQHPFKGRIYYCKIWNGGTLVRDFIPVRVGQVGYMYDKVSVQLFGNSGTGDFVFGGDIIGNGAYRKLNYVQGFTSALATNIIAKNSQWEFDLVCDATPSSIQIIIAASLRYGHHATANTTGKWGLGAGVETTIPVTTRSIISIGFSTNSITMTIGQETISRTASADVSNSAYLFGFNSNQYRFSGKIYSVKCTSGGSFNGVPAQRISDNKNGIYDLANNIFYPLT